MKSKVYILMCDEILQACRQIDAQTMSKFSQMFDASL